MVDEHAIEQSKMEEAAYQEKANELQIDIEHNDAVEQERENRPKSRNIFAVMKDMFERKKAEGHLVKKQKEYIKNEYEDKIREARKQRAIQEMEKKMQDKLDYTNMTHEERAARTKDKVNQFASKLGDAFGGAKVLNMSDRVTGEYRAQAQQKPTSGIPSVEKLSSFIGMGSSNPTGKSSGSGFVTNEKIHSMLGGHVSTNVTGKIRGNAPSIGKIGSYLGTGKKGVNVMGYLGTQKTGTNILGYLPKATGRNYANEFGTMGMGNNAVPVKHKKKGNPLLKKQLPQETQEDKIRRMIGL
jgi:hypothetical protein